MTLKHSSPRQSASSIPTQLVGTVMRQADGTLLVYIPCSGMTSQIACVYLNVNGTTINLPLQYEPTGVPRSLWNILCSLLDGKGTPQMTDSESSTSTSTRKSEKNTDSE